MPSSPRVRYKGRGRTGGEIGEAPPVADAARRFRGSAPIGGRDSGRESVGTTVGNRWPLRKRILWCVGEGLRPSHGRPQGSPLRRITRGRGTAGRCRHRPLRMTRKFLQARAGGQGRPPLRKGCKRCGEVRYPPVTASPCQPPLGKGALGTGDADCHGRFAPSQ